MWDLVGNPEDRFSHNEAQPLIDCDFHIMLTHDCMLCVQ